MISTIPMGASENVDEVVVEFLGRRVFDDILSASDPRERVIENIDEELRSHVEMQTEANIERGMRPEEARLAAMRSFGRLGLMRDLAYDVWGGGMLETLWQDLRL
jgi:hypothetical protein